MKNLKIDIPEGYEIDTEKTYLIEGNIVFKPKKAIEYVDLELPSGTLWASENVDDNYYTFDEAIGKFKEQLPTLTQFQELMDYTNHTWDDKKQGMSFVGKNGKSIFFPAAGLRLARSGALNTRGSYVFYWSASPRVAGAGYYANFNSGYVRAACTIFGSRAFGLSVRLVKSNFL